MLEGAGPRQRSFIYVSGELWKAVIGSQVEAGAGPRAREQVEGAGGGWQGEEER